jgi:CheY-like chemotaxis protein
MLGLYRSIIPHAGSYTVSVLEKEGDASPKSLLTYGLSYGSISLARWRHLVDILIVDDDVDCVLFLSRVLKARYPLLSVGAARTGDGALEITKNDEPSLVLTDLRMPGISGLELSQQLKTRPGSNVKVVLMTSENVTLVPLEHVDGILSKPFSLEALYKQIDCYCKLGDNSEDPTRDV